MSVRSKSIQMKDPVSESAGDEQLIASALTTRTHLMLSSTLPLSEWKRIGEQILLIADSSTWWLGDWLLYGERRFPDRYRRAISKTHLDYGTLRNCAWVARKFEVSRRREKLSFNHHLEVASLPVVEQEFWLNQAEKFGWSKNRLRKERRAGRAATDSGELPDAGQDALPDVPLDIAVPPEKQRVWQEAAARAEREFSAWIGHALDQAAKTVLGEGETAVAMGSLGPDMSPAQEA
jgi:hypothetical protein